jgi:hypothetical protein
MIPSTAHVVVAIAAVSFGAVCLWAISLGFVWFAAWCILCLMLTFFFDR